MLIIFSLQKITYVSANKFLCSTGLDLVAAGQEVIVALDLVHDLVNIVNIVLEAEVTHVADLNVTQNGPKFQWKNAKRAAEAIVQVVAHL